MIKVGNLKSGAKGVYIGRAFRGRKGSPLANPFPMRQESERDLVISRYRAHLEAQIAAGDPEILVELARLQEIHQRNEEVVLVCYCHPRPCHGDVVKDILETMTFTRPATGSGS